MIKGENILVYAYEVQIEGESSFYNSKHMAAGRKAWQITTLSDNDGVNGRVIVYRRPWA